MARQTVTVSDDALRALSEVAQLRGLTQAQALRGAIATEVYLAKELAEGAKLLLKMPNGDIREIIFR